MKAGTKKYLVEAWDKDNRRFEPVGNPEEDSYFPTQQEALAWIRYNIQYCNDFYQGAGNSRRVTRADYRITRKEEARG